MRRELMTLCTVVAALLPAHAKKPEVHLCEFADNYPAELEVPGARSGDGKVTNQEMTNLFYAWAG